MNSSDAVPRGVAFTLHVLVARLDRSADRILRADLHLSYPRYLLLLTLRRTGPLTQRALADELGITEPTVSRTVAALADAGLTTVTTTAGRGNRRSVDLTPSGRSLVDKGADRLEDAFRSLVAAAGVDHDALRDVTERLVEALDLGPPPGPPAGPPPGPPAGPPLGAAPRSAPPSDGGTA